MADLFLLSDAQMHRIEPYFPLAHGIARVIVAGRRSGLTGCCAFTGCKSGSICLIPAWRMRCMPLSYAANAA